MSVSLPTALAIQPSQYWDGYDGPWSSFGIQVGSPAQSLRVLPGTGVSSVWVVHPIGCPTQYGSNCEESRGRLFQFNDSTSWEPDTTGTLSIYLENFLGLGGSGQYGYDTINVGWPGTNAPTVQHQLLTASPALDFYTGFFPLNPRGTNFTDLNNPVPSLLQNLKSNKTIPSLSWGYTAGGYNPSPRLFGSLTLGGYDTSRFSPNNVRFPFGTDISYDFTVAIQDIATNVTNNGTTSTTDNSLINGAIMTVIDTLVPDIWLPLDACLLFEKAFGIVWNAQNQMYVINDSLHATMQRTNPSVTFKIGPSLTGESVSIVMPYWSFHLQADFPKVKNSTRYFPLKRAANDTQYVIGRAFLQAAYLSADYERSTFNLSQALFPDTRTVSANLVSITPKDNTSSTTISTSSSSRVLSVGAIAGIVAGFVFLAVSIIIAALLYRSRKRSIETPPILLSVTGFEKAELDATDPASARTELDTDNVVKATTLLAEAPVDESCRYELYVPVKSGELAGIEIYEMPAEELIVPELSNSRASAALSLTPTLPIYYGKGRESGVDSKSDDEKDARLQEDKDRDIGDQDDVKSNENPG